MSRVMISCVVYVCMSGVMISYISVCVYVRCYDIMCRVCVCPAL